MINVELHVVDVVERLVGGRAGRLRRGAQRAARLAVRARHVPAHVPAPSYRVGSTAHYRNRLERRRRFVYFLGSRNRFRVGYVVRGGSCAVEVGVRRVCGGGPRRSRVVRQRRGGGQVAGVPIRPPRPAYRRAGSSGSRPTFHSTRCHRFERAFTYICLGGT